jgi:hypothetical protein
MLSVNRNQECSFLGPGLKIDAVMGWGSDMHPCAPLQTRYSTFYPAASRQRACREKGDSTANEYERVETTASPLGTWQRIDTPANINKMNHN